MKANKLLIVPGVLATTTLLTGAVLTSTITHADGNTSVNDTLNITVNSACTMMGGPTGESTTDNTYQATIDPGTYSEISGSKLVTLCNDSLGYSIYAIGYSGDSYDSETHTAMIGTNGNITTATTGNNSYWAMKLQAVEGLTPPTISDGTGGTENFTDYHVIPSSYTQIAKYTSSTASASSEGASVQTKYKVNISSTQLAGSYTGKVKYTMVHPNNAPAPTPPVASLCATGQLVMQEVSSWQSTVTTGNEVTACDARDGKTYTVARFNDGNLWMTQNLDHDIKSDGTVTYDNTTTDLGYNASTGEYGTASWSPTSSAATIATADKANWTGTNTAPQSYDPGDLYWNGTISDYNGWDAYLQTCTMDPTTYVYSNCNESLNPISTYTSSTGNSHYHLGNYYNWTAAVAMTDSSTLTTQGTLVEQSICPTGWTLPRVGNGDDTFKALWDEYGFTSSSISGDNKLWTSPLFFSVSGGFSGVTYYVGFGGAFWSPVVGNNEESFYAGFSTDGGLNSADDVGRLAGSSVRCVARPVASTVSF